MRSVGVRDHGRPARRRGLGVHLREERKPKAGRAQIATGRAKRAALLGDDQRNPNKPTSADRAPRSPAFAETKKMLRNRAGRAARSSRLPRPALKARGGIEGGGQ